MRHKKIMFLSLFLLLFFIQCKQDQYPYRWFFAVRSLQSDSHISELSDLVRTAAKHNLNGMVLSAGFDRLDLQPASYFRRLTAIKDTCVKYGVEIIPIIFSVGYGSSVLAHDQNLAAGLPVMNQAFVVKNGVARTNSTQKSRDLSISFNHYLSKKSGSAQFIEKPNEIGFEDRREFRKGNSSLRFQNFERSRHGHGRLMQEITVTPYRNYRISCFVKTENLRPASVFQLQVYSPKNSLLNAVYPKLSSTADWQKVSIELNSLSNSKIKFYAGVWGGKKGRFWLDDIQIEELGMVNLLRRPGTPVTVKNMENGTVYSEGKDYTLDVQPLDFHHPRRESTVRILPGSRIKERETLLISYYCGMAVRGSQVSLCMSESKLYKIWQNQVALLKKYLAPKKFFLSMDEIRAGGSCSACQSRNMAMAQILGDCVTRQVEMIKSKEPEAEIFIWSDMFDPNHNAHAHHYLVDGDFSGSWNYIPKDLTIVCWNYAIRDKSFRHFSENGFHVLAAAYYDGKNLDNPLGWLKSLEKVNTARGIMYTSWQNKYELLAPFAELLGKRNGGN